MTPGSVPLALSRGLASSHHSYRPLEGERVGRLGSAYGFRKSPDMIMTGSLIPWWLEPESACSVVRSIGQSSACPCVLVSILEAPSFIFASQSHLPHKPILSSLISSGAVVLKLLML